MIAPGISPLLVSGCFIELRAGRGNLKSRLIEESTKLSKTFENSFHACDATTELKKRNLCPQAILLITLLTRHFRFVACCGLVFFVLMINFKVLLRWPCQQFLIKLWHQCVLDRRRVLINDVRSFQHFLLNCSVY